MKNEDKLVVLDYSFVFNPRIGWQRLSNFERDMQDFFSAFGLEAQIIPSVEGGPARRIMYVKQTQYSGLMNKVRMKNETPQNAQAGMKGKFNGNRK